MVEKKAEEREEAVAEIKKKDRSGQTRGVFFNTIKINREWLVYEKGRCFVECLEKRMVRNCYKDECFCQRYNAFKTGDNQGP